MKITLSRLSNSILASLVDQTLTTSKKEPYSVVHNHTLLTVLETEFTNYIAVFGKPLTSGMGPTVEKADMQRDAAFCGMKTILLGYEKLPGFKFQQDAIDLYRIFENRGLDINNFSYHDQSTEMDKLISELSQPENLAKLENLHLTPHFETMKTAEADFKSIYSKQLGANTNLRLTQSASSIRRNLESALRNYFSVVEGMKNLAGWGGLYTELSELTKVIRNSSLDTPRIMRPVAK